MGVSRFKPEFEDLAALAREKDLPLRTIRESIDAGGGEAPGT
jgi:uncharacterized protein (DUF111 family)